MRQKYIEGTNQKYSVREDGIVISHCRNKNTFLKSCVRRNIIGFTMRINTRNTFLSISNLLVKYFSYCYCKYCNCKIYQNKRKPTTVCEKCREIQSYKCGKEYNNKNKDLINKKNRETAKYNTKNITKTYVSGMLGIKLHELPDDLYEFHKTNLKLKRLIKQKQLCQEKQQIMQN